MKYGFDIYPTADYRTQLIFQDQYNKDSNILQGQLLAFDERMKSIGMTWVRYSIPGEYYLIKREHGVGMAEKAYTESIPRVMSFVEEAGYSLVLGIDVTRSVLDNWHILDAYKDLINVVELHNEPSLEPWYIRPELFYGLCENQIISLRQFGIPFCLNYHSMSDSDQQYYEPNTPEQRMVFRECGYLSPHSYTVHDLESYNKFNRLLMVTEYNVFKPNKLSKYSPPAGKWREFVRAFQTWRQLRKFKKNKDIMAAFIHHAVRYAYFTEDDNYTPTLAAKVHKRFAK